MNPMEGMAIWIAAEKIQALMAESGRWFETRPLHSRMLHDQLSEIQVALAAEFGRRRGWLRARHQFTPAALQFARMHSFKRWPNSDEQWPYPFFDHSYWYRTPDRRAAAVVVHLYNLTDALEAQAQAWAVAHRLQVTFPVDFPSWWNPGGTRLVVYERAPLKDLFV